MPINVNLIKTKPPRRRSGAAFLAWVVLASTLISFAGLWLQARHRHSAHRVSAQSVPVKAREAARATPKEPIRKNEVPAKLTDDQWQELTLGEKFTHARTFGLEGEALYRIKAVNVRMKVADVVQKAVYDERIRTKLEMILMRNNIRMDEASPVVLSLEVDGRWDKDQARLTHSTRLRVYDLGFLVREGEVRQGTVEVWTKGSYGYAEKGSVEPAILGSVQQLAEEFARQLVSQRTKEANMTPGSAGTGTPPNRS